jgi:nitrogen fixation protein FixH
MSMTADTTGQANKTGEFRLTGRMVLVITVTFFALIFGVNGVMVYLAIGTFPGAVTGSSYKASQEYNKEIAAAAEQAKLGWKVSEHATLEGGAARITLEGTDANGAPLTGLAFTATLQHPVKQGEDRAGEMKPVVGTSGRFEAVISGVEAGQWELVIDGSRDGKRLYRSQNRVIFK